MIVTRRLDLIPATTPLLRASIEGSTALAEALRVAVPGTWPHEFLDEVALKFVLRRLKDHPQDAGWWFHFVVLRDSAEPILIGSAGYKGPPSGGMLEVGYGIVADRRRQGFASEAVGGLLRHAFQRPDVDRVIAETYPTLVGSIGVLRNSGFRSVSGGSEPEVIRFEITRSDYTAITNAPTQAG